MYSSATPWLLMKNQSKNEKTITKNLQWIGSVDWHVKLVFSLGKTVNSGSLGMMSGGKSTAFANWKNTQRKRKKEKLNKLSNSCDVV